MREAEGKATLIQITDQLANPGKSAAAGRYASAIKMATQRNAESSRPIARATNINQASGDRCDGREAYLLLPTQTSCEGNQSGLGPFDDGPFKPSTFASVIPCGQ